MRKPQRADFKQAIRGYNIGGCVDGSSLPADVDAHAHLPGSKPRWAWGYICAVSRRALIAALLHELAHLAANNGHGEPWRKEMRRLGARIPAHHRKRAR